MNVTECLLKITDLTNQNLHILQALNESFFSKQAHITTDVNGTKYTIPSFINLENKVNHLQSAFDNLVHAAQDGTAWMNFDGNSKKLVFQGFQQVESPVIPPKVSTFSTEEATLFKDMLSPKPYISFNLNNLPDNVTQVVVKKIVPYNAMLLSQIQSFRDQQSSVNDSDASFQMTYGDMYSLIQSGDPAYIKGVDYLEYDSTYDMPIRKATCEGQYIISQITSDIVDEKLDNYITVVLDERTPCVYYTFDGVTQENIQPGCILTNYDGSCQLEVADIQLSTRTMKLKVLHGSYVYLLANTLAGATIDAISDYSKLRFYSANDEIVSKDRILHIPLEEDRYVFIVISPLNSNINVQAAWGTGLMIDTNKLTLDGSTDTNFRDYYNQNVKNIGDSIIELTTIMAPSITKFTTEEYAKIVNSVPMLNETTNPTLQVVQINKHLNNSEAAKNIRALYSQKQQYNTDLEETQNKISSLNEELSKISFDDMSGTRSMYTSQITDLKSKQNELITSIGKIMDAIATAANDATIPIEDAKFRIRGYFDVSAFLNEQFGADNTMLDNVIGIQCQYRYKNPDTPQANVNVINNFLFTEWVDYNPPLRKKYIAYKDGKYIINFLDVNSDGTLKTTDNDAKFNQIDIPISQGEIVDVRCRVLWAFGYPYTQVTSAWSEVSTITFPEELIKDVQIKTIIEENNSDIENNRFENILSNKGITKHVDDMIQDQDITYFHKPENISSGFYTDERRVIPLKDKLLDISNQLTEVQDTLAGSSTTALKVQVIVDNIIYNLEAGIETQIHLTPYSSIIAGDIASGSAYKPIDGGPAQTSGIIKISNSTNHNLNLYSIFPGPRDLAIQDIKASKRKFETIDYYNPSYAQGNATPFESAPLIGYSKNKSVDENTKLYYAYQTANQYLYMRLNNPYNGSYLGGLGTDAQKKLYQAMNGTDPKGTSQEEVKIYDVFNDVFPKSGCFVGILANKDYEICLDSDAITAMQSIPPQDSISIPIIILYKITEEADSQSTGYTIGFDIRNSLYSDPIYYQVAFSAKFTASIADTLSSQKQSIQTLTKYNVTTR